MQGVERSEISQMTSDKCLKLWMRHWEHCKISSKTLANCYHEVRMTYCVTVFLRLALSAKDENVAIFYFDPHSLIVVEPEVQCLWGVKLRPTSHNLNQPFVIRVPNFAAAETQHQCHTLQ